MPESNNSFKKNIERTGGIIDNIKKSVEKNKKEDSEIIVTDVEADNDILMETTQDLLNEVLKSEKKIRSFPHTIYLTEETGNALVKYAQKANKSKSAFLEDLLRRILLSKNSSRYL